MKLTKIGNMEDVVVIVIPRTKLKAGGRKRWKGVEKQERSRILSAAGKATWANFTSKERSVEMKRRARVRERNRTAKAQGIEDRQGLSARQKHVAIKNAARKPNR